MGGKGGKVWVSERIRRRVLIVRVGVGVGGGMVGVEGRLGEGKMLGREGAGDGFWGIYYGGGSTDFSCIVEVTGTRLLVVSSIADVRNYCVKWGELVAGGWSFEMAFLLATISII